jgi:uncharacterized alkaline shock family protein YloU
MTMKIRWYDRILLFIVAVFLLAAAALFVALPLFGSINMDVTSRVANLSNDRLGSALLIGGGAILLILSIYLLCVSFARKKVYAPKSIAVRQSEIGSVEISLEAIDTLVQKCARGFSEVRDCKSKVTVTQFNDIIIAIRLHIMPDTDIPDLTARMQAELKSYVERISGISVREVKVLIESTGVNLASKVQ